MRIRFLFAALLLGLAAPACGGGGDSPTEPPSVGVTTVAAARQMVGSTVTLEGSVTGDTSDADEKVFADNTGSIVLDFPSDNVASVGQRIRVTGVVTGNGSEVDVSSWQPI